jgi:beta-phosphoglucomutase
MRFVNMRFENETPSMLRFRVISLGGLELRVGLGVLPHAPDNTGLWEPEMADRAVIFDMDGVLVDSYSAHFQAWQRLAAKHGLEMTEAQFAATFGRTGREIILDLWGRRISPDQAAALDAEKETYYRQVLQEHFPEMPGASRLLEELHQAGFALAVGSSGPSENVDLVVRRLAGGRLFDATVNGMEVGAGKPDPAIFLLAARKLGVTPAHCAVIEDAPSGVQAGLRAGMAVIAVTGTAAREKLLEADMVVDSLLELSPRLIAELLDRRSGIPDGGILS